MLLIPILEKNLWNKSTCKRLDILLIRGNVIIYHCKVVNYVFLIVNKTQGFEISFIYSLNDEGFNYQTSFDSAWTKTKELYKISKFSYKLNKQYNITFHYNLYQMN